MTASFADNEIWHVLIDSDDMKRMNVDQLDDAFRLSLVDASTLVWKAGMKTWQSLGSVAGLDDAQEPEAAPRRAPPPPPPPMPAPRQLHPARAVTAPNPFLAPPGAFPSPNPFAMAAPNPFAAALPASHAAPFSPQTTLKAPVYSPPLRAPDPYVLPKRRAAVPSEVDFRRASGGVRFGRWLLVGLLLSASVLALYRQNLLREGARRVGLENKYLYGEKRVTSFVDAQAPASVKHVLAQLKLLPGPNALAPAPAVAAVAPVSPAATPTSADEAPAAKADDVKAEDAKPDGVKTVSLDSLPVEVAAEAASAPEPQAPSPAQKAAPAIAKVAAPKPASAPRAKAVVQAEKPAKIAKAAVERPKAQPKPAPAQANDNPLKAAIRSAIAADAAK